MFLVFSMDGMYFATCSFVETAYPRPRDLAKGAAV
jgi:hypothetical protein